MKLKNLLTDDDAVSPVIGVILMVAITVILAAVIGTFVLGLGQNVQSTAPQASFSFDQSGSGDAAEVTITHDGGDTISQEDIKITVAGDSASVWSGSKDITAGDSVTVTDGKVDDAGDGDGNVDKGDTIRVIWTSDSGENSQTLSEYTVA